MDAVETEAMMETFAAIVVAVVIVSLEGYSGGCVEVQGDYG
jgi:hypothetical protein